MKFKVGDLVRFKTPQKYKIKADIANDVGVIFYARGTHYKAEFPARKSKLIYGENLILAEIEDWKGRMEELK